MQFILCLIDLYLVLFFFFFAVIQCCVPFGIRHSVFLQKRIHIRREQEEKQLLRIKVSRPGLNCQRPLCVVLRPGGEVKIRWSRLACKIQQ